MSHHKISTLSFIFLASLSVSLAHAQDRSSKVVFKDPKLVLINNLPLGSDGTTISTEEPFLSRDGEFLFFNSGEKDNKKDLHYSKKIDGEWIYQGEVGPDINTPDEVEGNPSLDSSGNFYFIDSRVKHMARQGKFDSKTGRVLNLREIVSLPPKDPSLFSQKVEGNMGVEISADGSVLYFDRALWPLKFLTVGPPKESDMHFMTKRKGEWHFDPSVSDTIMKNLNSPALEYAESISRDGLEIFFTRLEQKDIDPARLRSKIMYSYRRSTDSPFELPHVIEAIGSDSFVEGPAISSDESELYYHKMESPGKFRLYKVSRNIR